jgi:hypothetical protein
MMAPRKERGQILILLATWLFFGGGAASALLVYNHPVDEMKTAVAQVITDSGRKDAILSDISQWQSVQELQNEEVSENREELLKILRRKDAPRSELEPIMAKLDKTFVAMDWDFLNLRFRVKGQVTRAEWPKIVARPPVN